MEKETLTQKILPIAKRMMLDHFNPKYFENEFALFIENINTNENTISITYLNGAEQRAINNEKEFNEIISDYIKKSLDKYNKVLIYTCRDNRQISIEDMEDVADDELYKDTAESPIPELKGILFIIYD